MKRILISLLLLTIAMAGCGSTNPRTKPRDQADAPASAALSGAALTLGGQHKPARVSGGAMLSSGEFNSSAPFAIQDADGGPDFSITQSSIHQTTVGAYPNLMVGCLGVCTPNNPFPLQLSAIQPGQVTTSVTSVTPSTATGTWADFYDIYITAGANQLGITAPREELEIWQNQNNRRNGPPVATGVSLDGQPYNVYLPHASVPGAVAYIPETRTDTFNGDLLPFIQDSIRRGYAKPSWYLVTVRHGFEISQGNVVGLGDANFSVHVGT